MWDTEGSRERARRQLIYITVTSGGGECSFCAQRPRVRESEMLPYGDDEFK